MKFSTIFTLATLTLLSIDTQARIGGGQHRQLGSRGEKCDPNYGGQCFHLGKDFKCQNTVGFGATPDYRCVNTKPAPAPAPPAPKPKNCNPNQNPTYTPECPSGFTCKAILGGSKKNAGQCMKQSDPKPAPTPAPPKKCNPNQNPTYTPECPSGYACEALLGSSKKNVGQCMKQSNRRLLPVGPKEPKCTRHCSKGKPCGDSCIADGDTCHKLERGKACWADLKCTKFCDKGQACGNSCISKDSKCHLSPGEGFACNKKDYESDEMPPLPPPVTPPPTLMPLHSGKMPYTVFVANTQKRPFQAGLINGNDKPMSYNDVNGGDCVKIGEKVYTDTVTYFTNPKDGSGGIIFDEVEDCEVIGNMNNYACDLPNLPENACVILV